MARTDREGGGSSAPTRSTSTRASRSSSRSSLSLDQILYEAGFRGQALQTAKAIAMAESGGNATAHNGNAGTGDNSYGLFQINMLGAMGPARLARYGLSSNEDLFDPLTNAKVAFKMSNGGKNWQPWSTFKTGAYRQYLNTGTVNVTTGGGGYTGGRGASAPMGQAPSGDGQTNYFAQDSFSEEELAAQFGWADAVIKSDPELKKLFADATQWYTGSAQSDARFQALLRDTDWYQKHSESQRQLEALKATDPASYNAKVQSSLASIQDLATQLGAQIDSKTAKTIATNVLTFGWNESQIRDALATYVKGKFGGYGGEAGQNIDDLRKFAYDNGFTASQAMWDQWAQNLTRGQWTEQDLKNYITEQTVSKYPGLAAQLKGGMTVAQIAQPYVNSMAQVLEVNPGSVTLDDPLIKQALTTKDDKGNFSAKSLWQFEQDLRNDPRWQYTDNARNQAASLGHKVLQDMGFAW